MVFSEICVLDILVQDFQRPFFGYHLFPFSTPNQYIKLPGSEGRLLDDLLAGPLTKLDFLVRLRYSKHKYHTFPFEEVA